MLGLGAARDHMAAGSGDKGSGCSVSSAGVSAEAGSYWSLLGRQAGGAPQDVLGAL